MKQVDWKDRLPGDIGLVCNVGIESDLIVDFEGELHEDYSGAFLPSHVFIQAPNDMIIESVWNRMTSAAPDNKYECLPLQMWRLTRTDAQIKDAINTYLYQYGTDGYGVLDLLGFALQAVLQHLGNPKARNPILCGYVCSMSALIFLRYPSSETWPRQADLRDCDPLALLMMFLSNEVKP
jgi:hypothetical protein